MQSPSLAIIGCGWLGKHLIAQLQSDYQLIATTAHGDSAARLPIPAHVYCWEKDSLPKAIQDCDHTIIAIPPSAGNRSDYPQHMHKLANLLTTQGHIIMISSTSVYPQQAGQYDEISATDSNSIVYQAEQHLRQAQPQATILRCAGLIGDDRILGKRWFGQPCDLPDQPLNLIHHRDIAAAVLAILRQPHHGLTYNLVHPDHISRHAFYRLQAQRHHTAAPIFTNHTHHAARLINGHRITREQAFHYAHSQLSDY